MPPKSHLLIVPKKAVFRIWSTYSANTVQMLFQTKLKSPFLHVFYIKDFQKLSKCDYVNIVLLSISSYVAISQKKKKTFVSLYEKTWKGKFHQDWGIPLDFPIPYFFTFSPSQELNASNQINQMKESKKEKKSINATWPVKKYHVSH